MKNQLFLFYLILGLHSTYCINNQPGPLEIGQLGSKKCMKDLGCFEMTKDFFHPEYRPFNFLPQDKSIIDTRFYLYTRNQPMEPQLVKFNDIDSMEDIDETHLTLFIVHGFMDNQYYAKWMEIMKDNLLLNGDYNVFIVDWSKGNGLPYTQATANTRVVGAEIALLIKSLGEHKNINPMNVHIIGHSLGSHIAGYAGQILKNLGRITALDPAGPYFQYMPTSIRLDPTDAEFVDAIHTDTVPNKIYTALGMHEECGHVDFYPNNGRNQPGCKNAAIHSIFMEGLVDAAKRFIYCNHQRSVDFFTYSINYKKAPPVGFNCENWANFINGKCAECNNGKCVPFGMQANKYRAYKNDSHSVKMYLATFEKAPFWEYTFQLTLKLAEPKHRSQDKEEIINLKIEGTKNTYNVAFLATELENGVNYNRLVREMQPLGQINGIIISWSSKNNNVMHKSEIQVEYISLKPMNVDNEKDQMKQTKKFCNEDSKILGLNNNLKLTAC